VIPVRGRKLYWWAGTSVCGRIASAMHGCEFLAGTLVHSRDHVGVWTRRVGTFPRLSACACIDCVARLTATASSCLRRSGLSYALCACFRNVEGEPARDSARMSGCSYSARVAARRFRYLIIARWRYAVVVRRFRGARALSCERWAWRSSVVLLWGGTARQLRIIEICLYIVGQRWQ
jgi:hypothetical protein